MSRNIEWLQEEVGFSLDEIEKIMRGKHHVDENFKELVRLKIEAWLYRKQESAASVRQEGA